MTGFTTLEGLKCQAQNRKREIGCTHCQALELVARDAGYANFASARRALLEGAGQ